MSRATWVAIWSAIDEKKWRIVAQVAGLQSLHWRGCGSCFFASVKTARGADWNWVIGESINAHDVRVFNGNCGFIDHPGLGNTVSKFAFRKWVF